MKKLNIFYPISLLTVYLLMLGVMPVESYIAKRYTIKQIIRESSDVVFGTVTEVDAKRQTAKVKVKEKLKGDSGFNEINIRFDVYKGEKDHRREIRRLLKHEQPIIFFYLHEQGRRIDALGHIQGKWFQTQATYRDGKPPRWWMFTHTEVHLNADAISKRDSTLDFQKELRASLKTPDGVDTIDILVFNGNASHSEFRMLSDIKRVDEQWMVYQDTQNRDLPGIDKADILWIGFRSLSADDGKYRLNVRQENRIKNFVKNGGVVVVSGQDSDKNRSCETGWLPEPLNGVESPQRSNFERTSDASELFQRPNRVRSGKVVIDDTWNGWSPKYRVLATTNDKKEIVIAMLKHGRGMYLITSFRNNNSQNASRNRSILENLIHFAVGFLEKSE